MNIYIDGSAVPNPGKGSSLIHIESEKRETRIRLHSGVYTNNQAEYKALLMAFEYIINSFEKDHFTVFTDSQLIYGHMCLGWKINENVELVSEAKEIYSHISGICTIVYTPREENKAGIILEKLIK